MSMWRTPERRESASTAALMTAGGAVKVTRLVDMPRDRHLASGNLRRESAPLSQRNRASQLVDLPGDELALLNELVVHLCFESAASPVPVAETADGNSLRDC
jgi:hypothetical protein